MEGSRYKVKARGMGVKVSLDFFLIGSYNSYWRGKCTW